MQQVCVCRSCGRTINKEYIYCPWCGFCQTEAQLDPVEFESVFSRLQKLHTEEQTLRINRLNKSLVELEKELSLFISSAEDRK